MIHQLGRYEHRASPDTVYQDRVNGKITVPPGPAVHLGTELPTTAAADWQPPGSSSSLVLVPGEPGPHQQELHPLRTGRLGAVGDIRAHESGHARRQLVAIPAG